MAEFDYGIDLDAPEEDVEVDTGGDEAVADAEGTEFSEEPGDEPESQGDEEDDPWAWAKGEDPSKVRKTWERFTNELESVKERERQLSLEDRKLDRFRLIAQELESDPGLAQVINDYVEKGGTPESQLENMRTELLRLQTQVRVQGELVSLHKEVAAKGLPDFDDDALVEHAIKTNAPSIDVAYRDMMFEEAQRKSRDKLVKDIKKSKGAAAPKTAEGGGNVKRGFTTADIAGMSEEDFLKNYDEIMKQASSRRSRAAI